MRAVSVLASSAVVLAVLAACSGGPEGEGAGSTIAPPAGDDGEGDDGTLQGTTTSGKDAGNGNAGNGNGDAGRDASNPVDHAPCGAVSSASQFKCSADGVARVKCSAGKVVAEESCARGCLRGDAADEDTCMDATAAFSCTGTYGTTKAASGDYYITSFGCWIDDNGTAHGDSGDNCIPSCLSQAKAAGLCDPNGTGKACEEKIGWFTADGARFGCLAHVRVTDPASGKSVIAIALDYGPSCSVEKSGGRAVLDAAGKVDRYLFGADQGVSDKTAVHVVEVDSSLPLGPVN